MSRKARPFSLPPLLARLVLKAKPEELAFWYGSIATPSTSEVYERAYRGSDDLTSSHPHVVLLRHPRFGPACGGCFPMSPKGRERLKDVVEEVAALLDNPDRKPVEMRRAIIRFRIKGILLGESRAVEELHHPYHEKEMVIGCKQCDTLPLGKAIYLFAERYANCFSYRWVQEQIVSWRDMGRQEEVDRLTKAFKKWKLSRRSVRTFRVWLAVQREVEKGRPLQEAIRESRLAFDLSYRSVEDAYYDGVMMVYRGWLEKALTHAELQQLNPASSESFPPAPTI